MKKTQKNQMNQASPKEQANQNVRKKQRFKNFLRYFSLSEKILWISSAAFIITAFCVFDGVNYLTLCASLVGVTSLVFNAKGNPIGQALMLVFSALYGIISYGFKYYGEMATYLGMTAPMSLFSLISWLKNPYAGNKSEVAVGKLSEKAVAFMIITAAVATGAFYFILKAFNTANLALSTVSVTTSFLAVYLTYKRSPYYALAYCANDVVLIGLWILAAIENSSFFSVVICFIAFLINDAYGFINWQKMKKRQQQP